MRALGEDLAACCRLDPPVQRLARIAQSFLKAADPDAILAAVRGAGLLPLFYERGRALKYVWPGDFEDAARAAYAASLTRAAMEDLLAGRFLAAAREAPARVILLKGIALRQRVYPDPAVRPMADLDAWVHPADRDHLHEALLAAGYRLRDGAEAYRAIRRCGCDTVYLSSLENHPLDLHWGFHHFERYQGAWQIDPDRLWSDSVSDPSRPGVRYLPLDLELLHLAFHAGAGHGFRGGVWRMDLWEWLARWGGSLDWDETWRKGEALKACTSLAWAVRLLARSHGRAVPASVAERLDRRLGWERLATGAMESFLPLPKRKPTFSQRFRELACVERGAPRAEAVCRGLFTSAALRAFHAARRRHYLTQAAGGV